MKRRAVLISLVSVAVVAVALLLRSLDGEYRRAPTVSNSAAAGSTGNSGSIPPPEFLPPRNAAESPAAIERRFASASNYRDIIDRRAEDPAQSSFFYAALAQSHCATVASLTADTPSFPLPKTEQSATARKRLSALCAGVKVGPNFTAMTIADEGIAAKDLFFSSVGMFQDFLGPLKSQPADVAAVIELTAKRETPILASAALEVLSLPHVLKTLSVFGEPAAALPPDKLTAMSTAMLLVRCDLGTDCGSTNFEVEIECALNGNCAKSLEESLRADYERQQRGNRPDWSSVQAYRERIIAAVAEQKPWIALP